MGSVRGLQALAGFGLIITILLTFTGVAAGALLFAILTIFCFVIAFAKSRQDR